MKIMKLDKNHAVTYGLDVYQLRLKLLNSQSKEVFIWLQLIIGEQPNNIIDETYDITLINMNNESNFFLPCLISKWIDECLEHYFSINHDKEISFRIQKNHPKNNLRIIKFLSFIKKYYNKYIFSINKIDKLDVLEFKIKKKKK